MIRNVVVAVQFVVAVISIVSAIATPISMAGLAFALCFANGSILMLAKIMIATILVYFASGIAGWITGQIRCEVDTVYRLNKRIRGL